MPEERKKNPLDGRTLYVTPMTYSGARCICAALGSIDIDARLAPKSDENTLELGGRYTSGEECLPEKVTMGDYLAVTKQKDFDPAKTAFLMPTANGPCRFGQYRGLLAKVLREMGHGDVPIFAPTSANGYNEFGGGSIAFLRTMWRAAVLGDALNKALLRTRPYELRKGDTDEVFERCLDRMDEVLRAKYSSSGEQMGQITRALETCRHEFESIPADYSEPRLLIGIVGEIFCRLNEFSNNQLLRKLEEYGCETWQADVAEWVFYTNDEQRENLKNVNKGWWHPEYWKAMLKESVQRKDEHEIYEVFGDFFRGYEEPETAKVVLDYARPYLPQEGALGEMVLSTGKSIYLYEKGVDGIVDISPFTCMNGIITEAIYPVVSREHEGIPIRTFYFDGISSDLDRDVGIFVELARSYNRRKTKRRVWPHSEIEHPAQTAVA